MAIEHVNIPSEGCHEPKHITNAVEADSGKVITPSNAVPGQSVLRFLEVVDIRGAGNTPGLPVVTDGSGGLAVGSNGGSGPLYGGLTVTANSTSISSTAAASTAFSNPADYTQVGVFDASTASPMKGVLQGNDTLVVPADGVYSIDFWANIASSNNGDLVAFNFGVNGTVSTARPVVGRVPNNIDPVEVGAHALITLAAGDVVSMWVASKLTSNITIVNGRVSLTLVDRL